MSEYIYNDEDNVPMNEEAFDAHGHNPTVYTSYAEMKAMEEPLPFTDEPDRECRTCIHYDGSHCTREWNNLDPDYYIPDRDDVDEDDTCDEWELDPDWEEY